MIHTGSVWFFRTDPVWITENGEVVADGENVPGAGAPSWRSELSTDGGPVERE